MPAPQPWASIAFEVLQGIRGTQSEVAGVNPKSPPMRSRLGFGTVTTNFPTWISVDALRMPELPLLFVFLKSCWGPKWQQLTTQSKPIASMNLKRTQTGQRHSVTVVCSLRDSLCILLWHPQTSPYICRRNMTFRERDLSPPSQNVRHLLDKITHLLISSKRPDLMQWKDSLSAQRGSSWEICQCSGSFWLKRIQTTPRSRPAKFKRQDVTRMGEAGLWCSAVSSITSGSSLHTCCLTYTEAGGTGLQSTHTRVPGAAGEPASSGWESQCFSQTISLTPVAEVYLSCCHVALGGSWSWGDFGSTPCSSRGSTLIPAWCCLPFSPPAGRCYSLPSSLPPTPSLRATGAAGEKVCFSSFL